jgi:hypothetical protein
MTAESQDVHPATQQGDTDPKVQKEAFEKRALLEEWAVLEKQWYVTFCHLVRALADAFGEEEVLDSIEKTWWELGFEAGRAWRQKFDQDPNAALLEKAHSWHDDPVFARGCCGDVPVLESDHWELRVFRCHKEVFLELGEPKIGMAWCMRDFATVRGWSPRVIMRQPKHLFRGDNCCHQIRMIVDDPSLQWDYSKETSEKVGWRSVKKLEEA